MPQVQADIPKEFTLVPKVINGAIAGLISIVVVYPLDLVKTRLQNQPVGPNGECQYKNMLDCFVKTYRAEGYFAMYKGAAVNIAYEPFDKALKLTANDFFRFHLTSENGELPIYRQMLAGGLVGVCQNILATPVELLKIRMQDYGRMTKAYKKEGKITLAKLSALKMALGILKAKGIFGLYRGSGATCIRDVTFATIYFPTYATLDALGPRRSDGSGEAVIWCNFLAGLCAGALAGFSATPMDVIKTRLQAGGKQEYLGYFDCVTKTFNFEGMRAFFKGGLCRVIIFGPNYAITQAIYYVGFAEALLDFMKLHT